MRQLGGMDQPRSGRRRHRGIVASSIVAAVALTVVPLTAAGPSSLPSCTTASLVPNLANLSAVQGLPQGSSGQAYALLARGKETLVRASLTLPTTCAVSKSQSITPKTATLAVSNPDGAQPTVSTYNMLSGNLTSTTQIEGTSDPLFVVPASDLTPSATTSFSLGLTLTLNYAVNGGTTTTAVSYPQKNVQVDQRSRALRVLVAPMGDPAAGTLQWTDTDQAALQKLMTTASRVLPVETGTGDLSSAATGGIRYVVNQGLLDVKSLGLYATGSSSSSRLCANGANWSSTQVLSRLTLKGQLAQTLADWNSANPTRLADVVVGVIDENNSWPSNNTVGLACDDGRAATPLAGSSGQVAWVRVTSSGTNSPGVMELVHTIGIVDQTIASSLHSPNVEADLPNGSTSPDPNNGYNALQRKVLYAGGLFGNDHSAMNYNSTSIPYTNDNLLLEPRDWADIACDLGGTCGTASGGTATLGSSVGTTNGVAAGSSGYDINGTVNGDGTVTVANAHIIGNFLQTGLAPSSAALHLFERTGSCASPGSTLKDIGIAQFADEGHSDQGGGMDAGVGSLFHAITEFDTSATVVQLALNGNVVFCKSIGTAGQTPSVQSTSSVAPGSVLASFPMPACCNGRAIAFDGTHLWVTNNGGSTLMWELTTSGQVVRTFDTGVVLGSLAYNPGNGHLIGGNYNASTSPDDGKVWDIQPLPDGTPDGSGNLPVNKSLLFQFNPDTGRTTCRGGNPGAIDGLERLADGSFALSGDVETTVHLLTSAGVESGSFSTGCNSGITTDGADGLWLALLNSSCCDLPMTLQHVTTAGATIGDPITITGYEAEDIAFDAKTFAPSCVVWLNQGTSGTAQTRAVAVPCPAVETNPTGATFTATGTDDVGSAYFTCDAANGPFYPIASGLRPTDVENGISRFVFYYNTAGISCGNGTPKILTAASNFFNQSPLTDASAQLAVSSSDKTPTAAIDAPVQNETYLQGATIAFNGTGADPEEGNLTGTSLVWRVDGTQVGIGNSFDKTTTDLNLSPGTHTVSLAASDSTATGTAQATIVITADATPPALALSQSPIGNPWVTTSPVNVTVTGSDKANANDTGLASVGCSVDFLGVALPAIQNPAGTYSASFPVSGDGIHQVSCLASDKVGNQTAANNAVYIDATPCNRGPGHTVLSPVNTDGSSVFKLGNTVPVKFRVCVGGVSVITPVGSPRTPAPVAPDGVQCSSSVPRSTGTPVFCHTAPLAGGVNEGTTSTAADAKFRWDPIGKQMVFNLATSSLTSGLKYTYYIPLADGSNSDIFFTFGLK